VNTGDPWPDLDEAEHRVLVMQRKLHRWAVADPGRRFDDLANLVYDPAFLLVAWTRVRGNKGARTAGVDGVTPRSVGTGAPEMLDRLREYVQDRLAGNVRRPDGTIVAGPTTLPWKGLNKPHRQDRRWSTAWSPEQIARRLEVDFPDDESMRVSHEAIYQSLFIEGRGALKRELVTCLRTGRALREPRARSRNNPQGHVTADVVLSERPAEAEDRSVPGHWEGDLIIGTGRSAIGTLVERSSRATLLVHLPRMEGWGEKPYVKNGPSLGGYGAVAMNAALTASMTRLPDQLRKTLTWDRGKELSGHAQFALATGTRVFFADPHSPWQRPTNENTNGLLRQYFPKGTDLSRWSADDLEAVAHALNNRPRKILDWKTPAEVFEEQLNSLQQAGVASTS
jgi:IS30 family transposase